MRWFEKWPKNNEQVSSFSSKKKFLFGFIFQYNSIVFKFHSANIQINILSAGPLTRTPQPNPADDNSNVQHGSTSDSQPDFDGENIQRKQKPKRNKKHRLNTVCSICQKDCGTFKYLNQHIKTHGPKKMHVICVTKNFILKRHKITNLSESEKTKYRCIIWQKIFRSRYNFKKKHRIIHGLEKRFSCKKDQQSSLMGKLLCAN